MVMARDGRASYASGGPAKDGRFLGKDGGRRNSRRLRVLTGVSLNPTTNVLAIDKLGGG
jgi:hypothetical protein